MQSDTPLIEGPFVARRRKLNGIVEHILCAARGRTNQSLALQLGRIRTTGVWRSASAGLKAAAMLLVVVLVSGCMASSPKVDDSATSRKLENMPRPAGERPVVAIYKFRSSVRGVSGDAATDMFSTALIKSGQFAVAERARLNEGVMKEKQLNAQGMSTGDAANYQLAGAKYIFEGVVSEVNADKSSTSVGGKVRGLGVQTQGAAGSIGIDVRVIDARNGVVLDAINVRKDVKQRGVGVSGVGSFVQSVTKKNTMGADVNAKTSSKEGVDEALRECIEETIYQLATRYGG